MNDPSGGPQETRVTTAAWQHSHLQTQGSGWAEFGAKHFIHCLESGSDVPVPGLATEERRVGRSERDGMKPFFIHSKRKECRFKEKQCTPPWEHRGLWSSQLGVRH